MKNTNFTKNKMKHSQCIKHYGRVHKVKYFERKDGSGKFAKAEIQLLNRKLKPISNGEVFPIKINSDETFSENDIGLLVIKPWYDFSNDYKLNYSVQFYSPGRYDEKFNTNETEFIKNCGADNA